MQIKTMVSVSRLANNFTVLKTHGDHFADSTYSLQQQWRPAICKYWQVANGIQDHIMLQIIKL